MEKIYILDAVNYLFRAYYAIGPMLNDQGQSTSALFGFIRSIQKLIRDFSPTHLVAVFDGPDNKKQRQAVYADYKMHRKGAPEDLYPQFEWAYQYCEMAGIPALSVEGVEADDTMATIALWAKKKKAKVFLCSSDKDLMQLVDDQIFMLQLHKDNLLIDAKKVEEIYGVRPDQILDLLAIMGDASDNIPGLEGFGPKTAASLLQEFGTLDAILEHPEKVKGAKKQEVLKSQQKEALLSRELATLNTAVSIPQEPKAYALHPPSIDQLLEFFQKMKFNSLIKELQERPMPPCKAALHTESLDYQTVDDEEALLFLIQMLEEEKEISLDTETTHISPLLAHLVGIGLATQAGKAYYIPMNGALGKKKALLHLSSFFARTGASFFGHHLKYDYHILKNSGIELKKIGFDTLIASQILEPQKRRHNLDELCLEKFGKVKIPLESLIGKGKKQTTLKEVPIEQVSQYCCEDVDYTLRLKDFFEPVLREKKLDSIMNQIELPLLPILADMERTGIYLNVTLLQEEGKKIAQELSEIRQTIYQMCGEEFNLNSPKQLASILYEKMAIKPKEKSTSAEVLEELAEEHVVVQEILKYRTLEKLRSTYIEALPHQINPITDRIHCTFNQTGTATGRLSCQDPNLQNIPLHSKVRACFQAQEGFCFLGADYSQVELRILAHFSEDEELLFAFRNGRDIHVHTASLIYGVDEGQVSRAMRQAAKTVNFGIVYGQTAFGLSKQLGISVKEASDFIKKYFDRYPKVRQYLEESKEKVRKKGYSLTLMGRQRPIPEIHNKNPSIRFAAERLAINTPLQGTQADLIKMAMIEIERAIRKKGLRGKMILQIHDELIFEVPEGEISLFQEMVKKKMEGIFQLKVPLEVDTAVGKNWAEC